MRNERFCHRPDIFHEMGCWQANDLCTAVCWLSALHVDLIRRLYKKRRNGDNVNWPIYRNIFFERFKETQSCGLMIQEIGGTRGDIQRNHINSEHDQKVFLVSDKKRKQKTNIQKICLSFSFKTPTMDSLLRQSTVFFLNKKNNKPEKDKSLPQSLFHFKNTKKKRNKKTKKKQNADEEEGNRCQSRATTTAHQQSSHKFHNFPNRRGKTMEWHDCRAERFNSAQRRRCFGSYFACSKKEERRIEYQKMQFTATVVVLYIIEEEYTHTDGRKLWRWRQQLNRQLGSAVYSLGLLLARLFPTNFN